MINISKLFCYNQQYFIETKSQRICIIAIRQKWHPFFSNISNFRAMKYRISDTPSPSTFRRTKEGNSTGKRLVQKYVPSRGYDLCLNLFTKNKTHQIRSAGLKRPQRVPSTQLTTILFVFTYGRASDKKMPHDISRFYTRPLLP